MSGKNGKLQATFLDDFNLMKSSVEETDTDPKESVAGFGRGSTYFILRVLRWLLPSRLAVADTRRRYRRTI
jgi:hypothetical protein